MSKFLKLTLAILLAGLLSSVKAIPAKAGGLFATNIFVQAIPAEERALIIYSGGKETIFDSVTFNINPLEATSFAWIIPVPSKPDVSLVLDDLYIKAEKISDKKISKNNFLEDLLYFDVIEEKNIPASLYSRGVDFTTLEIFSPDRSISDLELYLAQSGYHIPKLGKNLVEDYHKKGWYFIVARVNGDHLQMDAGESLTVPGAHTYPLKIEFNSDKIIYPLKLAQIQPDYDSEKSALSFSYGTNSTDVLGVKDEKVDELLQYQSQNKYPRTPMDFGYQKIELFVLTENNKVNADGFTAIYAGPVNKSSFDFKDFTKNKYFDLPKEKMYLTRLYSFKPMIQLDDVDIKFSSDNRLINSRPETAIQIGKIAIPILAVIGLIIFSLKKSREE